jgi:hypothetical protein
MMTLLAMTPGVGDQYGRKRKEIQADAWMVVHA